MRRLILLLALMAAAVQSSATCVITSGPLRLEKPRYGDSGAVFFGCMDRTFNILSSSVPLLGGTTAQSFPHILTSTIGALTPDGIRIASAAYFTTAVTGVAGSSWTLNDKLQVGGTFYVQNGRVGVGTSAPDTKGHMVVSGNDGWKISDGTQQLYAGYSGGDPVFGTLTNHPVRILQNGAAAISVIAGGSVGIGTASPGRKLSVDAGSDNYSSSFSAVGQTLQFYHDSGGSYIFGGGSTLGAGGPFIGFDDTGAAADQNLYFGFAGTANMTLNGAAGLTLKPLAQGYGVDIRETDNGNEAIHAAAYAAGGYLVVSAAGSEIFSADGAAGTSGDVVVNEVGGDFDFRVESDNQAHAIFLDASADALTIQVTSVTVGSGFTIVNDDSIVGIVGTLNAVNGSIRACEADGNECAGIAHNGTDAVLDTFFNGSAASGLNIRTWNGSAIVNSVGVDSGGKVRVGVAPPSGGSLYNWGLSISSPVLIMGSAVAPAASYLYEPTEGTNEKYFGWAYRSGRWSFEAPYDDFSNLSYLMSAGKSGISFTDLTIVPPVTVQSTFTIRASTISLLSGGTDRTPPSYVNGDHEGLTITTAYDSSSGYLRTTDLVSGRGSDGANGGSRMRFFVQDRSAGNPYAALTLGGIDGYALQVSSQDGTAMMQVDKYGNIKSTTQPAARVTRTAALSIPDNTNTELSFVGTEYNTQSLFAVSAATVPVGGDGYYRASLFVSWANSGSNYRRVVRIQVNGATPTGCGDMEVNSFGSEVPMQVSCTPHLVAGDVVKAQVYHNTGSPVNVNSAALEVMKLW